MKLDGWLASNVIGGDDVGTWLLALLLFAVVVAAVVAVKAVVPRWVRRTANGFDDLAGVVVSRTRTAFAVALGALAALAVLTLPESLEDVLQRLLVAVCVVQGGSWGTGLLQHVIEHHFRQADPLVGNATGVLRALGVVAVWAVVLLLLLANLGVDVTAGIAGLGVGGVAVALAVQNVLGDVFASLSIVFDRPFSVGDFVAVDAHLGTVEHIGLKTTRIRSLSGEQLVFGNSDLLRSRIKNYQDLRERRCVFTLGVAYGTPHATLKEIPTLVREAIEAAPGTRFDRAHFFRFGESSLDFEVVWFFLGADYNRFMDAQHAIYLDILDRFTQAGVDIPFPQRTVWVQPLPASEPIRGGGAGAPPAAPGDAAPERS